MGIDTTPVTEMTRLTECVTKQNSVLMNGLSKITEIINRPGAADNSPIRTIILNTLKQYESHEYHPLSKGVVTGTNEGDVS